MTTSVVILFDKPFLSYLVNGKPPVATYSHDQMLFQFGHESLRKGYEVYIESSHEARGTGERWRIGQFYPVMEMEAVAVDGAFAPELVVCSYPQSLNLRALFPAAKIIGILPAVNFLEYSYKPTTGWVYGFFEAARTQVDFYITQNVRMAEIAADLFRFVARADLRDRILVCPQGIVAEQRTSVPPLPAVRAEMGLLEGEIAFINAGGPWSWTDYNTFLKAFCNVVRGGLTNIKFYIMGFKQPENPDHTASVDQVKATVAANKDLVGRNLIVFEDWYEAAEKVFRFTFAADIGVNVSKDTPENWQSYRLRFLDYMKAGIPVIHTTGDYLSGHEAAGAVYPAEAGNIASYEAAIRLAATDGNLRANKAEAMKACAGAFDSRNTYGKVIDRIMALPPRDFANPHEIFEPALLTLPAPAPTPWKKPFLAELFKKLPAGSNEIYGWRDGDGPAMHKMPQSAANSPMSLGFELSLFEDISASWAEIMQVGRAPHEARLIVSAVHAGRGKFRLVLRLMGVSGHAVQLVTHDLPVARSVDCAMALDPAKGDVCLHLNGCVYKTTLKPWQWIAVDCFWLGSRRLPAKISKAWVRS